MKRGDIVWADLGGSAGRRPVCVLTRNAAIEVLATVTCAPITRVTRGIRSEVEVGQSQGLPDVSVITCDNLVTVPQAYLDDVAVGRLTMEQTAALDHAVCYALDIRF